MKLVQDSNTEVGERFAAEHGDAGERPWRWAGTFFLRALWARGIGSGDAA